MEGRKEWRGRGVVSDPMTALKDSERMSVCVGVVGGYLESL